MDEKPLPSQDPEGPGPIPEPKSEPREPNPGGADALPPEAASLPADRPPELVPDASPDATRHASAEGESAT
ncbi:hypothetical protein [Nocardioides sp.]|uniref:hypothetical protein n=1 Tax=Nocardioides sp. TaxID=35761 RepID=UPI00356AABD0